MNTEELITLVLISAIGEPAMLLPNILVCIGIDYINYLTKYGL